MTRYTVRSMSLFERALPLPETRFGLDRTDFRAPWPLAIVDRLIEDVGMTLFAHRLGQSHDHGEGSGETNEDDILAAIRREAEKLHTQLSHGHGVSVIEVMGSTGSGKTTLLEGIIERAPENEQIGVIVGDVAGDDDARRFRELGVEVANVNTGKECHLDPGLVKDALKSFDLDELDTLYIENVGNMVCPADFPLGAAARVLVVSTTEGDDVVRKHPLLFQSADAAVINKTDIADAVGADLETMRRDVAEANPNLPVFDTNATAGTGIEDLQSFLQDVHHLHDHGHGEGEHNHGADHHHDHEHGEGKHEHSAGDNDHGNEADHNVLIETRPSKTTADESGQDSR